MRLDNTPACFWPNIDPAAAAPAAPAPTALYCSRIKSFGLISDLTQIMLKAGDVEVMENRGLVEVCLMSNNPTSTALNVNVTSIASGSATGEN